MYSGSCVAPLTSHSMPPHPLTERQHKVLRFIERYLEEHGYAPTYEEIGEHIGAGLSTVYEHIGNLVAKGRLAKEHGRQRALRVLVPAKEGPLPGAQWVHRSELPQLFAEWLRQRGLPDEARQVLRAAMGEG